MVRACVRIRIDMLGIYIMDPDARNLGFTSIA